MTQALANEVRTNGRYGFRPVGGLIRPEAHYQWGVIHGLPVAMEYAYGSLRA